MSEQPTVIVLARRRHVSTHLAVAGVALIAGMSVGYLTLEWGRSRQERFERWARRHGRALFSHSAGCPHWKQLTETLPGYPEDR